MRKDDVPDPPAGLRIAKPHEWTRTWARVIAAPSVKLTGFALLTWADYGDGANIRPGYELLMRVTGIGSKTTVSTALSQIADWGFIWRYLEGSKAPFYFTADGKRKRPPDEYRLTWPDDVSGIPMLDPDWRLPDEGCG